MRERIAAYHFPRGGVEVVRASRGYTLYSRRTAGPVARLRPTGDGRLALVHVHDPFVPSIKGLGLSSAPLPLCVKPRIFRTSSSLTSPRSAGSM